jgi:hypothetical protein
MCIQRLRLLFRSEGNRKLAYFAIFWLLYEIVFCPVTISTFSLDHDFVAPCFYDYQQQHWDNATASWQWVCQICIPLADFFQFEKTAGDQVACQNFTGLKEYCQTPQYCELLGSAVEALPPQELYKVRIYRYPTDQIVFVADSGLINLYISVLFLVIVIGLLYFLLSAIKIRRVRETRHSDGFLGKFGFLSYLTLTVFAAFVSSLAYSAQNRVWGAVFSMLCLVPLPFVFWIRHIPYDANAYSQQQQTPTLTEQAEREYDTHLTETRLGARRDTSPATRNMLAVSGLNTK